MHLAYRNTNIFIDVILVKRASKLVLLFQIYASNSESFFNRRNVREVENSLKYLDKPFVH